MQPNKKRMQWVKVIALSFLTVWALGIDMATELPQEIITFQRGGLAGVINNLLMALNHFHTLDHLTCAVASAGCVWLYRRYLYDYRTKALGEYALALFFACTMLASEGLVAEDTLVCLWNGGTQVIKSAVYLCGMTALFLAALRALGEALQAMKKLPELSQPSLWRKYPFAAPLFTMIICWLPVWIAKYPGGMSPDVTVQILDYQNQAMTLSHPPFTTVAYGWFYQMGVWLGNANWGILALTALQTVLLLCVLAFSCAKMIQWRVPGVIYALCLGVYCIAPSYSGYVTSIVKDIPYLIGCILLNILMVDFSLDTMAFVRKKSNLLLLVFACTTIWLWRRNGVAMVAVCLGIMLLCLLGKEKKLSLNGFVVRRFAAFAIAVVMLSCGINAAVTAIYPFGPAMQREVYSHLLQMTGRVAVLHDAELPQEEKEIINRVVDYEKMLEGYNPIITDGVKFHFREDATQEEYAAYRKLVWKHFKQYPMDCVDSYLNLVYRLFDVKSDRGMNIDRREISHPFYIRSYTNLLYEQEELTALNAAQEAAENWHFWFPDLPIIGLLMNIGFCTDLMLAMLYMMVRRRWKKAWLAMLPAVMTAVFCLASPVVYIRYALPLVAALPLWFAAWCAYGRMNAGKEKTEYVS